MAVVFSLLGLPQCDGRVITLGQRGSEAGAGGDLGSSGSANGGKGGTTGGGGASSHVVEPLFTNITLIKEIAASDTSFKDENPTLTADLLELYFYSTRRKGTDSDDDVWVAKRAKVTDVWNAPVLLTPVSTALSETSPAISADGLKIWVGVDMTGGLGKRDIWRYERTSRSADFGATAILEPNVNSTEDDIPRPPGNQGKTMPLASRRDSSTYQTYFTSRASATGDFATPSLITELTTAGEKFGDGFLSDDGLTFFFAMGGDGKGDIYVTTRTSVTSPFDIPVALSTINTTNDERDPWLSPDGGTLYFMSNRTDNVSRIFQATRVNK